MIKNKTYIDLIIEKQNKKKLHCIRLRIFLSLSVSTDSS